MFKFSLRRFFPKGLLGRTVVLVFVPLLLSNVLVGQFFYTRHFEDVGREMAFALASEVSILVDQVNEKPSLSYLELFSRYSKLGLEVQLLDDYRKWGNVQGLEVIQTHYLRHILRDVVKYPTRVLVEEDKKLLWVYVKLPHGVLEIQSPLRRIYMSTFHIFLGWLFGSLFLILLLVTPFIRAQVRSVRALAKAAERFGRGEDVRYKATGAEEVRLAGRSFLIMKQRLNRFIQTRTEMLTAVSHDIRTPLTRMRLTLEMMEDGEEKAGLLSDISDMEKMVNGYLEFSRDTKREDLSDVYLKELLDKVVRDTKRHTDKNVQLHYKAGGKLMSLRINSMERALVNILENARRYAKDSIDVYAVARDNRVEIIIDDDGKGIPEAKREDMFRPFVRLDPSRNSSTGGVGLGLSMAKNTIELHGGRIELRDVPKKKGLRVFISLPI